MTPNSGIRIALRPVQNLYCERPGLSIPRLDDVAGRKGV